MSQMIEDWIWRVLVSSNVLARTQQSWVGRGCESLAFPALERLVRCVDCTLLIGGLTTTEAVVRHVYCNYTHICPTRTEKISWHIANPGLTMRLDDEAIDEREKKTRAHGDWRERQEYEAHTIVKLEARMRRYVSRRIRRQVRSMSATFDQTVNRCQIAALAICGQGREVNQCQPTMQSITSNACCDFPRLMFLPPLLEQLRARRG